MKKNGTMSAAVSLAEDPAPIRSLGMAMRDLNGRLPRSVTLRHFKGTTWKELEGRRASNIDARVRKRIFRDFEEIEIRRYFAAFLVNTVCQGLLGELVTGKGKGEIGSGHRFVPPKEEPQIRQALMAIMDFVRTELGVEILAARDTEQTPYVRL